MIEAGKCLYLAKLNEPTFLLELLLLKEIFELLFGS
jgi:hypothetical protein